MTHITLCLGYIQACRALMITSVLLGLFGVIISLMGMKFIKIGHTPDHLKAKIATFGGIMLLLSGEFPQIRGIAVSKCLITNVMCNDLDAL